MRELKREPILTDTFESVNLFTPVPGSVYIYRVSSEDRSGHTGQWQQSCKDVQFIEVTTESVSGFQISGGEEEFFLRSAASLSRLLAPLGTGRVLYVDITGLSHPTWAALIRAAIAARMEVRAVYVEPYRYKRSAAPLEGQIYDLSARIAGIAPMPGFATISTTEESVFVPLLGFEGARFRHVIEQVQPSNERMVPVVGIPGFKPWYVFEAYMGNRAALEETSAWHHIEFVPANCPFSCFYLLQELAQYHPNSTLKVAMIGTKPHALGAVMFALTSPNRIELIYDNPIRKEGRTDGLDRLLVYHVGAITAGAGGNSMTTGVGRY
ncbi:hypothetical protein QRD40_08015 [Comamonas sp. Y6]|uniref:Uncharacterized protein n=1 Tax=Comamonas resistens TaxID=3046670 RepID=A0ABY8STK8_9BURK|nr:hypothetical protein [Comamonas resistens]MDL5036296.1 hypothetical protein [Comamonas resistens]WHS66382.1 hypothetical protein QMY55_04340 [Comamonas resistens]